MDFELREPTIIPINDHTWLLNDHDEATGYVIAGTKRAAAIDTMIGLVDVYSVARKLTNLPPIP